MPDNEHAYTVMEDTQLDTLSEVLPDVIASFRRLNEVGRQKLFRTVATVFGLELQRDLSSASARQVDESGNVPERFSKDRPISPKEFLLKKQPRRDVERVACLAYYLTHYREQPFFKTLDISKLNTEAAQIKFSNPANSVDHASRQNYLTFGPKGTRQLSAQGEMFVEALPDREAAKLAMASVRPRRKSRPPSQKEGQ